jgi:hypothetical protein
MGSCLGKTIGTFQNGFSGNMSLPPSPYNPEFLPPGGPLPTVQDLNADGFMDIGSTSAITTLTVGNWFPRFTGTPAFKTDGTPISNGEEVALFHFNFNVLDIGAGGRGRASIDWVQQTTTIINSATYLVDGVSYTSKSIGTSTPTGSGDIGYSTIHWSDLGADSRAICLWNDPPWSVEPHWISTLGCAAPVI